MGRPLFCGSNDSDQVSRIFKVLGTPSYDSWPSMQHMPKYNPNFPNYPGRKLSTLLPRMSNAGLDLLERLLQPDPAKRISAREGMRHAYFNDLQGVGVLISGGEVASPQAQQQHQQQLYAQMEEQRQTSAGHAESAQLPAQATMANDGVDMLQLPPQTGFSR